MKIRGWLDYLLKMGGAEKQDGKGTEGSDKAKKIDLSEVKKHIRHLERDYGRDIAKEVEDTLGNISRSLKEVVGIVEKIRISAIPETTPKRLKKVVVTSKPVYCDEMTRVIGNFKEKYVRTEKDYMGTKEIHMALIALISTIQKIDAGSGKYLALVFSEDLAKIRKNMKEIVGFFEELKEGIGKASKMETISKCYSILDEIEERIEKIKIIDDGINLSKQTVKDMRNRRNTLSTELGKVEKSSEYVELKKSEEDLIKADEERTLIKYRIGEHLGVLKRPMRKMQNIAGSDKTVFKDIDGYIKNSAETFIEKENIKEIADALGRSIDLLKLEEHEKVKIEKEIKFILEGNLDKMKKDYLECLKMRGELAKKIEHLMLSQKDYRIKSELSTLERELSEEEAKSKKLEEKRVKAILEIEGMKKELEDTIMLLSGTRIVIKKIHY